MSSRDPRSRRPAGRSRNSRPNGFVSLCRRRSSFGVFRVAMVGSDLIHLQIYYQCRNCADNDYDRY